MDMKATWKRSMREGMSEAAKAARVAATKGMARTVERLKLDVREQIKSAGLGQRLANSIRGKVYPDKGVSLHPAGSVYPEAPHIIAAFQEGVVIRAGQGFLTIPTKNAPKGPKGARPKFADALKRFGTPKIVTQGGRRLVFFNVTRSKNGKTWRRATKRRAKQGRQGADVLMFVLVPLARIPKRLDLTGALQKAGRTLPANISAAWPTT